MIQMMIDSEFGFGLCMALAVLCAGMTIYYVVQFVEWLFRREKLRIKRLYSGR